MKRFWCSWILSDFEGDDYRPVVCPVPSVLGWWCSGYNSHDNPILCALVESDSEEGASSVVKTGWPEFDGDWRFLEEKPDGWTPGDRFPMEVTE